MILIQSRIFMSIFLMLLQMISHLEYDDICCLLLEDAYDVLTNEFDNLIMFHHETIFDLCILVGSLVK